METTLPQFLTASAEERRQYMIRSLRWDCFPEILAAAVDDKDIGVRTLAAQNPNLPYSLWLKCFRSRAKRVRGGAMKHPRAKVWSDPLYELRVAARS